MLCGLERDESGLVVCARVGDETQWLFAGKADAKSWNDAGSQLLRDGYAVIHGFLGANLALALREQARQKFEAQGHEAFEHINADFARHGLCSTRLTELDVDDSSVSFMPHLTRQGESLVRHLAHESVTELRAVVGRSRPMLAVYPGEGARYMRHVDNPGGNGRLLTLVYYLNFGWREREHGGCLRLWRADYSEPVATMAPLLDRAVLFWSDRRVPHEVMPAQRERIATQIWCAHTPIEHTRSPSLLAPSLSLPPHES
jgi:hypoxia-inducible factor (prolyl hydroxylase)